MLFPTTVDTSFCNIVRDIVEVDYAIMNSGGIQGNMSYEVKEVFYFSDLITELPFKIKLVILKVVIANTIAFSILNALKTPGMYVYIKYV